MKQNNIWRTCGVFVFNEKKELLVTLPYDEDDWEVPNMLHTNNKNYLYVALTAAFETSNLDFFNYKEEYFKPLKHSMSGNKVFCPYVIFNEKTFDDLKCWVTIERSDDPIIDDWDYVSITEARKILCPLHKNALNKIKI